MSKSILFMQIRTLPCLILKSAESNSLSEDEKSYLIKVADILSARKIETKTKLMKRLTEWAK